MSYCLIFVHYNTRKSAQKCRKPGNTYQMNDVNMREEKVHIEIVH